LVESGAVKRTIGLSMLLLAGCHHQQPKVSDAVLKKILAISPGITNACLDKIRWTGIKAMPGIEQCDAVTSEKRWRGLWREYFEDSRFCEEPAKECDARSPGVWVSLEVKSAPKGFYDTPPGGLYAVEVVGKETLRPDYLESIPKRRLVVHRFISVKQIEAPPPQPTKAEMIKDWKACEAARTCEPNWSEINKIED
jgi:hypothetical protein